MTAQELQSVDCKVEEEEDWAVSASESSLRDRGE